MPRGDRTGPTGMGPMTGRRAGYCNNYETPGYSTTIGSSGFGRAFGRGFKRNYNPISSPSFHEKELLENRMNHLENQLEEIKKYLSDIKEENR